MLVVEVNRVPAVIHPFTDNTKLLKHKTWSFCIFLTYALIVTR